MILIKKSVYVTKNHLVWVFHIRQKFSKHRNAKKHMCGHFLLYYLKTEIKEIKYWKLRNLKYKSQEKDFQKHEHASNLLL